MIYVGLDIAKATIQVGLRPSGESWNIGQTPDDWETLVQRLTPLAPRLIVVEATGGYERGVVLALLLAELPVAVINPRQARDFAKATGKLAKTDSVDAQHLAHFGEALQPTPQAIPDAQQIELRAFVERRRQLVQMRTMEKQRLDTVLLSVQRRVLQHITWLDEQISEIEHDLDERIDQSDWWHELRQRLEAVPGIGTTTANLLIAELPELGQLTGKQIAALVGVAPLNRDSGTYRGKRTTWGGRAGVRATLYMATLAAIRWNPIIRTFHQRLREQKKPPKVAIVACMRKLLVRLNAMVKTCSQWQAA